eukprot:3406941-Lingulodinium_polyedra.AAC.1
MARTPVKREREEREQRAGGAGPPTQTPALHCAMCGESCQNKKWAKHQRLSNGTQVPVDSACVDCWLAAG